MRNKNIFGKEMAAMSEETLFEKLGVKYICLLYTSNDGTPFTSEVIGRNDCAYWDEQAKKQ